MGCKPSTIDENSTIPNMEKMYSDARLPHPAQDDCKTAFEKEFFQVVNLLRQNPSMLIRFVKTYAASSACQDPNSCRIVEMKLKQLGPLTPVELDGIASNACYVNLTKQVSEEGEMTSGGASAEFARQTSRSQSSYEALDTIKKRWKGSALDMVISILASFYASQQNQDLTHTLLAPNLVAIGSSMHTDKRFGQIFQVLYIKQREATSP